MSLGWARHDKGLLISSMFHICQILQAFGAHGFLWFSVALPLVASVRPCQAPPALGRDDIQRYAYERKV